MKPINLLGMRVALAIMLFIGMDYVTRTIDHFLAWFWVTFSLPVNLAALEFQLWFIEYGPILLWGIYILIVIQLLRWNKWQLPIPNS